MGLLISILDGEIGFLFGYKYSTEGLPWWISSKESACNAGTAQDMGSIPGLGRSPGRGYSNSLQFSCLENPMDRGARQTTVYRVAKSCIRLKRISMQHAQYTFPILHNKVSELVPFSSVQFSSVAQSCPTLCDPMNHSTPGLPVHHQLPEFTQTPVHQVGDAIQPSHPLLSPSPPASNPSQHQDLFQEVFT